MQNVLAAPLELQEASMFKTFPKQARHPGLHATGDELEARKLLRKLGSLVVALQR